MKIWPDGHAECGSSETTSVTAMKIWPDGHAECGSSETTSVTAMKIRLATGKWRGRVEADDPCLAQLIDHLAGKTRVDQVIPGEA
jgi:hypothetical protein